MKVYSFSQGGIVIDDPAIPSRDSSVTAYLPGLCIIPLVESSGRVYPIVSIGDMVKEGMLIGRGQGMGTANVYASVPGRVIKMVSWKMSGGQLNDAIVIRMEGSFEKLGKREESYPWDGMLPFDLQRMIYEFGVVEMEGSGRPVADIISSLRNTAEPVTLVVRCVFDDPWLAADYVLCQERIKAVVEGSRIMARITKASRIIYAVSSGEKDLGIKLLSEAGNWNPPSFLVMVGSKYPQRNRRELELALKNYGRNEGIDLGSFMILGPATLAAVQDAVRFRKPVMDRYVAVGGSAVKKPQIVKVRIGTRVGEVFDECGGFSSQPHRIATGSPISGRPIMDLDEPVLKTSYALYASRDKIKIRKKMACIGCGECRNVCPVGLDPDELYKQAGIKGITEEERYASGAEECHGCGCCDVVCPSRLSLSSSIISFAWRG